MQGELRAQPAALQREEQTEHQGGQHDALQQGAQGAWAERTRAAEHTGQHDEGRHSEGPACDVEGVQHVLPLHDAAHGVQNHDQCGGDEPGVVPPWIPGPFGLRSPLGAAGDGGGSREWLVHRGEAPGSGSAVTWAAALVIESGGSAHCARPSRRIRLPLQVHTVNPACTSRGSCRPCGRSGTDRRSSRHHGYSFSPLLQLRGHCEGVECTIGGLAPGLQATQKDQGAVFLIDGVVVSRMSTVAGCGRDAPHPRDHCSESCTCQASYAGILRPRLSATRRASVKHSVSRCVT